ncbi:MAG: hypothetical protein ACI4R6_08360, partial [Lachnospiraceae bacterium]
DEFYNQAKDAMEKINDSRFDGMFKQIEEQCTLCHGNFNYHNCFVYGGAMAITNFNKCRNDCQMWDLYQFMRKVLEKYRWNMELAYKLISEYDKVKTISDIELEFLYVLFEYPEKYWKIINYYLNTNKAWIPPKSYDKLNTVVQQQSERCEFLATTGVL